MNKYYTAAALSLLLLACSRPDRQIAVEYPETQQTDERDVYFGRVIPDPYRWLEDDNSEATKAWVEAQNKVTYAYLDQIPLRKKVEKRLTALWNYEKYSLPQIKGKKTYFFKNDGLQNQPVLYEQVGKKTKVILDPNALRPDGTGAIGAYSFSKNNRFLAYSMAESGSDWQEIYILDLETGKTFSDVVRWVKFSEISWEGNGFYYSRYPEPRKGESLSGENIFHQVFYHTLGTKQEADRLVFADRVDAKRNFYTATTKNEDFLILNAVKSTSGNALYFQRLGSGIMDFTPIYEGVDFNFKVIDNVGDKLLVLTNYKAPMSRIIVVDTKNPTEKNWTELIAETENVLEDAKLIGGKIVTKYLKNAVSQLQIFGLDGGFERGIRLPDLGTVSDFDGEGNDLYFTFETFTQPEAIYHYNLAASGKPRVYKAPKIDFDATEYITKQVFYYSKDSTKVPMFITFHKDLRLNGENPTWLYGYGGFNISVTPKFSPEKAYFLEQGGIYAVANIRGGGEFGERWHKSGTVLQKQNVFDDFMAAAVYLIDKNYTNSEQLGIEGRSNGGLLVGACMTQRPDLFKVALPGVGVLDMLRFQQFTIGWAWVADYGSSADSIQFEYLRRYSPLHNVQAREYPATLITTGDHDDRVVPAHSFKFAAALQAQQKGKNPILIRVDTNAGHGAGKSTTMKIAEARDKLSFLLFHLK